MTVAILLTSLAPQLLANGTGLARRTAKQELEKLEGKAGPRYAYALYNNPDHWAYVSKKIATGNHQWLQVAKSLIPRADGAFAEELMSDLALALLHRPANVLSMFQQLKTHGHFLPSNVCGGPFQSPGKAWLRRYKARAIRSVSSVRLTRFREPRHACLTALRSIDLSRPAATYE